MTKWVIILWSIALGLGNEIDAKQTLSWSVPVGHFQDLSDYQTSPLPEMLETSKPRHEWVIQYRGGQRWNDGHDDDDKDDGIDDDDVYDGEDEDDYDDKMRDNKNPNEPASDRYDHSIIDPPSARSRPSKPTGLPQQQRHSRGPMLPNGNANAGSPTNTQNRQRPRRSKHWSQRIASQGLQIGSQLAWGAVQQTGNVAYQLIKPRHVDPTELMGLWRLDQQISSNGMDLASVATVEMDPGPRLVTLKRPNGKTIVEPYTFQKTRLGSYQTEFILPAFLVGETPRLYGYRGTWQRKLADQRVIKLVGKIYKVKQQRFGKSKGKYIFSQSIGTFVARRRMKLIQDDDDDDEGEEFSDNDSAGEEKDPQEAGGQHHEYDDQDYDSE